MTFYLGKILNNKSYFRFFPITLFKLSELMPSKKSVLIITLARNEELTISFILKKSLKFGDVLVINDASDDNTLKIAKKLPVKVITNNTPLGYSNCKRLGLAYALEKKYQNIVMIDSDGEHSPDLIKNFIKNLKEPTKIVFGKRKIKRFTEKIICKYYQIIYGVTDILCGMVAINTKEIKKEFLNSSDDDLGMKIILNILRKKKKFTEINVFGKQRIDNSRIYTSFYRRFKYLKIIFSSLGSDIMFSIKKWF